MTDDLTKLIAEIRQLCDKAQAIIDQGSRPLVELTEVEPDPQPEGYDDPDSPYWDDRWAEAVVKLSEMSEDAYYEEFNKWNHTWTNRQIAELYEARIAELEAEYGR